MKQLKKKIKEKKALVMILFAYVIPFLFFPLFAVAYDYINILYYRESLFIAQELAVTSCLAHDDESSNSKFNFDNCKKTMQHVFKENMGLTKGRFQKVGEEHKNGKDEFVTKDVIALNSFGDLIIPSLNNEKRITNVKLDTSGSTEKKSVVRATAIYHPMFLQLFTTQKTVKIETPTSSATAQYVK